MKAVAVVGVAIASLLGTSAFAADMALKAPPAPAAPASNWTGFYLGADIGGRWSDPSWNTTCLSAGLAGVTCPLGGVVGGAARLANDNPASFSSGSLWGGVYGGYNYQLAPTWVIGVEGNFSEANNSKTRAGIPGTENPAIGGSPGTDSSSVKQTWDAGIRARLGYLITPETLVFVSGGGAWTHVSASAHCGAAAFAVGWCDPIDINTTSTVSTTLSGWSIGGGLEYMFAQRWLLRAEYRYSDYGHFNTIFFAGLPVGNPGSDAIAASVKLRTSTGLVGLAYKFSGP